jgi:hypothetical protein
MDEAFETLTLLQTGKSPLLPLVCVDRAGGDYWHAWDAYVRGTLLARGLISAEDLSLYRVTNRLDEAVSEIVTFYRNYHSSRYVGNRLVLRLHHAPTPDALARLEREFGDILSDGGFATGPALPEEAEESALADLPRLVFSFNRRDFGRLRQLIDALNRMAPPDQTTV